MESEKILSIQEKGAHGEERLRRWLQANGIGFFAIDQSIDAFPLCYKNMLKRPDFLVPFPGIGMIGVDAKNYSISCGCFTLSVKEIQTALFFQAETGSPFWFVYLHDGEEGEVWYWISAIRAQSSGLARINGATNAPFLAIDLDHFVPVKSLADLGGLLTVGLGMRQAGKLDAPALTV